MRGECHDRDQEPDPRDGRHPPDWVRRRRRWGGARRARRAPKRDRRARPAGHRGPESGVGRRRSGGRAPSPRSGPRRHGLAAVAAGRVHPTCGRRSAPRDPGVRGDRRDRGLRRPAGRRAAQAPQLTPRAAPPSRHYDAGMPTGEPVPPDLDELTLAELTARCGVDQREIDRMIEAGVVVPREGDPPFRNADILKIRVARACEEGGLPMDGMAEVIRRGLLSFAFVDTWPFERESSTMQTHLELADEVGMSFGSLQRVLEAFGFARRRPEDVVLETERPIAHLIGTALSLGFVDEREALRFGVAHAEALRRVAAVQTEAYHSGVEMPLLRSGASEGEGMARGGKTPGATIGRLGDAGVEAQERE